MAVKINVPYLKIVPVSTPAVGTELSLVATGAGLWRVISVAFRFVASAAVATRTVALTADDGTSVYFRSLATIQQTAGQTVDYGAFAGATGAGVAAAAGVVPLTQDGLWLQAGWRLRTSTLAIDGGDQYSNIVAVVEEFPSGPDTEWAPTVDRAEYERS